MQNFINFENGYANWLLLQQGIIHLEEGILYVGLVGTSYTRVSSVTLGRHQHSAIQLFYVSSNIAANQTLGSTYNMVADPGILVTL